MIRSNSTIVAQELDELSKHLTKFMCLNDNIDHKNKADSDVIRVKRMLVQFYETLFPIRSQFELPIGQTNRYANVDEYKLWLEERQSERRILHMSPTSQLICLFFIVATILIIFKVIKWWIKIMINVYS